MIVVSNGDRNNTFELRTEKKDNSTHWVQTKGCPIEMADTPVYTAIDVERFKHLSVQDKILISPSNVWGLGNRQLQASGLLYRTQDCQASSGSAVKSFTNS